MSTEGNDLGFPEDQYFAPSDGIDLEYFAPSDGIDLEQARKLSIDLANKKSQIYSSALHGTQDKSVAWTPDGQWVAVNGSSLFLVAKKDNAVHLTKSDFCSRLGSLLGVDTDLQLGVDGRRFFFDVDGRFAMVTENEERAQGTHIYIDRLSFKITQMTAGDFEHAEFLITTMLNGVKPLGNSLTE